MLKKLFFALCLVLAGSSGHAFEFNYASSQEKVYVALREDSLDWHISRKFDRPNLIREDCLDAIKMIEAGLYSQVTFCNNFAFVAYADYAEGYNKTRNHAYDVLLGLGYQFNLLDCTLQAIPYLGFSSERQHFRHCGGNTFINEDFSLSRLNSSYRSLWYSPWIGIDLNYALCEGWHASGFFAYHLGRMHAHGNNRLGHKNIGDTAIHESFHQKGDMHGFDVEARLEYDICCNWQLDLFAQFKSRKIYKGHQHGHYVLEGASLPSAFANYESEDSESGEEGVRTKHKLHRADWHSIKLGLGLNYTF